MYDLLMRLPLMGWCLLCTALQVVGLSRFLNNAPVGSLYLIHVAMRLSTITFLLLMVAAVILRSPPSRKASGLEPRISALIGTFMIYGIVLFPRRALSPLLELVSTSLIIIGGAGAVIALSQLGRSFSLMAETRQLVTCGPYRFVRHPLYLTEEIAMVGVFLQFASLWTAILIAVQIAFQLRRIHNEESVLSASFPEYTAYRQNTACLIPRVY